LQAAGSLDASAGWTNVTDSIAVTNGMNQLNLSATNAAQFFRLRLN
jgi:hypothetical protein